MDLLGQFTDRYSRTARLVPAVLVVLPLCVLAVTAVPVLVTVWGKVAAVVAAAGLPFVFAQVVRDRGGRAQDRLFEAWGGPPTVALLRWRTGEEPAVFRRHQLLRSRTGVTLPTAAAEESDPARADALYRIAAAALRERTRDTARFPRVFDENIAYGFRRNTYACRTPALVVCGLTAVLTVLAARLSLVSLGWRQQLALVGFDALAALGWLFWCTEDTVRRAADTYARQLFVALEVLADGPPAEEAKPVDDPAGG